jgi:predicted CoA-binding protein
MKKTTLVLGASTHIERYSNRAIKLLRRHEHPVIAVGIDEGIVADVAIGKEFPEAGTVDTLTLYVNPSIQKSYYSKILELKPGRIIFNPGTENKDLQELAEENGIATEEACTLVLLNTGQY